MQGDAVTTLDKPASHEVATLGLGITDAAGTARRQWLTNLDLAKKDDHLAMLVIEMSEGINIFEKRPESLIIVGISQRDFEKVDRKSGEVTGRVHTRLLTDDGKVYWTNSGPAGRVLSLLALSRQGKGKFDPPQVINFKYVKASDDGQAVIATVDMDFYKAMLGATDE